MLRKIQAMIAVSGCFLSLAACQNNSSAKPAALNSFTRIGGVGAQAANQWPDSLDALRAAPRSHRIMFENDSIRLLEVIVPPHSREPVHTHEWPSVMFGHHGADTGEYDIVYYAYHYDSVTHQLIVTDSMPQHHFRPGALKPEIADLMEPEGPHSISNISDRALQMYRIEFKSRPISQKQIER